MSGRIPKEVLDEILRRLEIAEVVGDYVSLTRAGRNFKALCPFHQEKTPSFMVSPERQSYHCFGCQAGGDAIKFVMEFEKTSFPEAVELLARRAGVHLPERVTSSPEGKQENDLLFEALRIAATFYARSLWEGRPGARARAYVVERGLSEETAKAFGLGYAPASWDALLIEAKRQGVLVEVLLRAGLVRAREDRSGHYDYFRDRLVFPIVGPSGRVLGFGGRSMDGSEPKYLNSPETPVFRKGATLYGLPETKNEIRNSKVAVIVEGYMDFLALYEAGFRNMVAPLGTAFTGEHARLLARYTPAAVLAYDGDEAGQRAAWAAGPLVWEAGLHARVAVVPAGDDPDSMVRRAGAAAWTGLLADAADFTAFALAEARSDETREAALRRLVPALAGIRDEIRRGVCLRNVASLAGMREETIHAAVKQEILRRQGRAPEDAPQAAGKSAGGGRTVGAEDPERELLRLLISYPELLSEAGSELDAALFASDERREIARLLLAGRHEEALASAGGILVEREIDGLDPGEDEADAARLRRRAVIDYVKRLRTQATRRSMDGLEDQTRSAQTRGDVGEALALLRQTLDLKRKEVGLGEARDPDGIHI